MYSKVQFIKPVEFTVVPWVTLDKVVAEDVYTLEDDGPGHVLITKTLTSVRVPWSNIAGATVLHEMPVAAPIPVVLPKTVLQPRKMSQR